MQLIINSIKKHIRLHASAAHCIAPPPFRSFVFSIKRLRHVGAAITTLAAPPHWQQSNWPQPVLPGWLLLLMSSQFTFLDLDLLFTSLVATMPEEEKQTGLPEATSQPLGK